MEQNAGLNPKDKIMESIIVGIFTLMDVALYVQIDHMHWGSIYSLFFAVLIFILWMLNVSEHFEIEVRFFLYTLIMQLSVCIYVANETNSESVILVMSSISIVTGLFGVIRLNVLALFVSTMIMIYYFVSDFQYYMNQPEACIDLVTQMFFFFLSQIAIFGWMRKREMSMRNMHKMISELHMAEQSKTNFLCNVSHELRTPINSICCISEIGIKESDLVQMRDEMGEIHSAGKQLLSVVTDILDYSELLAKNIAIEEDVYFLPDIIQEVSSVYYSKKQDKKIEILFDLDANIPRGLVGDEKRIQRVLSNLLDNAIKFTKEGYVLVSVFCRKENYGVNLCIEVKDTGIGMNREAQEKLFNSFTQVDGSSRRHVGGLGLGLSISKMLVDKMGGIISVESEENEGTTIKVVIPQKVSDEKPIVKIQGREKINLAVYLEMEQYRLEMIRGAYRTCILHCVQGLHLKGRLFSGFKEFERRQRVEEFTHVFISMVEYQEHQQYFDSLSERMLIVVTHEPSFTRWIENRRIIEVCKPFNIWSFVTAVNEKRDILNLRVNDSEYIFVAPEAQVLVVDDNEINLTVARRLLEKYEMKVTTATGGRSALEILEREEFDMIFLDHMMPEMDGIETLHAIRKMAGAYYNHVPVIALSANAVAGSREMFLSEGFDDFIEKPIDIFVLEKKCKRYLPNEKIRQVLKESVQEIKKAASKSIPEVSEEKNTEKENLFEKGGVGDEFGNESRNERKQELVSSETWTEQSANENRELVIGDLSVKDGLTYCSDEDNYLEILREYAMTGMKSIREIETHFENENWNDYTILVHATKSGMKTIGANELSERCKILESYGKAWKQAKGENASSDVLNSLIDRIRAEHGSMIEQYKNTIDMLCRYFGIKPLEETEIVVFQKTEEIGAYLTEFEDAAYDFDTKRMQEILTKLIQLTENKSAFVPIYQKIERSDLISASDMLHHLFQK